jgi:transcriptional regulator with XRE-family HTH domain
MTTKVIVAHTQSADGHNPTVSARADATTLLRQARIRAGWGQDRLARALHISRSALSMYEIGARPMPPELRRRAAQVLRAPEVLLQSDEAPLRGYVFQTGQIEVLDWVDEELNEALDRVRRMKQKARKGLRFDSDDDQQLFDLYSALDTHFVIRARQGLDLERLRSEHLEKLRRRGYLREGVVA